MAKVQRQALLFDDEADEQDVAEQLPPNTVAAVVSGNDWTTETIVSQLRRENIQLNPRFQRRDAWRRDRKSRFVESLIVGLPIPQIVLAETKNARGRFIVLDGKQRLLAILQFWGLGEGDNNAFRLSALTLRPDLKGVSFSELSTRPEYEQEYNALCNQAVRTVVIRNWKDTNFLHTVFLRLNTGSVNLSPQELRQALLPGKFSNYIDDAAGTSPGLRKLLGVEEADPRMRDTEILARFLAFRFFAEHYPGRMRSFLDDTFETFNKDWKTHEPKVTAAVSEFEDGVNELVQIFGDEIARKPDSPQFNRAIFDALIYYHSQPNIRKSLQGKHASVKKAYEQLFTSDSEFSSAIESDTAGAPNTSARLDIWGKALSSIAHKSFPAPKIPMTSDERPPRRHSKGKARATR